MLSLVVYAAATFVMNGMLLYRYKLLLELGQFTPTFGFG